MKPELIQFFLENSEYVLKRYDVDPKDIGFISFDDESIELNLRCDDVVFVPQNELEKIQGHQQEGRGSYCRLVKGNNVLWKFGTPIKDTVTCGFHGDVYKRVGTSEMFKFVEPETPKRTRVQRVCALFEEYCKWVGVNIEDVVSVSGRDDIAFRLWSDDTCLSIRKLQDVDDWLNMRDAKLPKNGQPFVVEIKGLWDSVVDGNRIDNGPLEGHPLPLVGVTEHWWCSIAKIEGRWRTVDYWRPHPKARWIYNGSFVLPGQV